MTLLVRIHSFLNLPLAEVAQSQLKAEGIDSCLGNSMLIAWFWQLGVAVGGIKLLVKEEDVARACEILELPEVDMPQSSEFCPQCGEPLIPGWSTCWRCAQLTPIESSDPSAADYPIEDARNQMLLSVAAVAVGLVAFMACGPIWLLAVVASMGIVHLIFEFGRTETRVSEAAEPKPDDEDAAPTGRRQDLVEQIARRAWRASVIGVLYFPPLAVYGIWLARRIGACKIPLSMAGRRRRLGALIFGIVGLAFLLLYIAVGYVAAFSIYTWIISETSPWAAQH